MVRPLYPAQVHRLTPKPQAQRHACSSVRASCARVDLFATFSTLARSSAARPCSGLGFFAVLLASRRITTKFCHGRMLDLQTTTVTNGVGRYCHHLGQPVETSPCGLGSHSRTKRSHIALCRWWRSRLHQVLRLRTCRQSKGLVAPKRGEIAS
ncbi:unnamed protein product [Amoebophrya sp. A25]|nr:unnamed protein product [Amoebophrya sp. A25]|eukprot:GSA25T00025823001.1